MTGQGARLSSAWITALCVVSLLACGKTTEPTRPTKQRPFEHLIMISIDTLRADHLGCYNHPKIKTPNIDGLAAEGILFEQFVSAAPTTLASHTSLMTGRYPRHHGVPRNGFHVPERNLMLAEVLRAMGFTTAGFAGAFPLNRRFGFDQGFETWDQDFATGHTEGEQRRDAKQVNRAIAKYLDGWDKSGRLFLFAHYFDVHAPYTPPPPYDRMYRTDSLSLVGNSQGVELVRSKTRVGPPHEAKMYNDALAGLYAGGVSYIDDAIGKLLKILDRAQVLDDALVILTADHGEVLGGRRLEDWDHGHSLYDDVIRVPLILRFPRGWKGGTRIASLVGNIDVFPSLLELLDRQPPGDIDGRSFASLLRGDGEPTRSEMFSEATKPFTRQAEGGAWINSRKANSIRTQDWKFVRWPLTKRQELYDLSRDPGELRNLVEAPPVAAGEPTRARAVERKRHELAGRLAAWLRKAGPSKAPRQDHSKHTVEALRALGYGE